MGDNPHVYQTHRTLTIKLPLSASAKLATLGRELFPGHSMEAVAAWVIQDHLVGCGLLELPKANRGKAAGKR